MKGNVMTRGKRKAIQRLARKQRRLSGKIDGDWRFNEMIRPGYIPSHLRGLLR